MEISGKGDNNAYWLEKYPGVSEEIYEGLPETRGNPLSTTVYFECNHDHDQVMWGSVSGVMCFVRSALISWYMKRKGAIETSSYSTEF